MTKLCVWGGGGGLGEGWVGEGGVGGGVVGWGGGVTTVL